MADPVVVPLRDRRTSVNLALGAVLLLGFAVGATAGVLGVDDAPAGTRVVEGLLGVVCLAGGVACAVALIVTLHRREIVIDRDGLSWRTARGGWTVRWEELLRVAVHTGWVSPGRGGRRRARVSLVLEPAGPGFLLRHPELRQVHERGVGETVRIPLVDRPDLVAPLAAGLAAHAGTRSGGVVDDGEVGNLSYRPRPSR